MWEGSVEHKLQADGQEPIKGVTEQGERAGSREALVIKAKWRKSGGCVMKECVLTWGDLALRVKGRRT